MTPHGKMTIVRDKTGREGRLLDPAGAGRAHSVTIALPDGTETRVPGAWLQPGAAGYELPVAFDELGAGQTGAGAETTVPVLEERLEAHKRTVEDVVRVRKVVRTHEERLRQELAREDVEIERVAVNREVSEPPDARTEGDVLVVPLLEEQLVWRKRLVLREEVRIRKRRRAEPVEERVPLRDEEVVVERERKP